MFKWFWTIFSLGSPDGFAKKFSSAFTESLILPWAEIWMKIALNNTGIFPWYRFSTIPF